jgi:hypothetical protein
MFILKYSLLLTVVDWDNRTEQNDRSLVETLSKSKPTLKGFIESAIYCISTVSIFWQKFGVQVESN